MTMSSIILIVIATGCSLLHISISKRIEVIGHQSQGCKRTISYSPKTVRYWHGPHISAVEYAVVIEI